MYENFFALDRERRDRIINAAMGEFASKGFGRASTNEIAKKAGISKSLLFYYFASKENLFKFLLDYSFNFFISDINRHLGNLPTDVFDRWMAISAVKIKVAAQHPDLADFIQAAAKDETQNAQKPMESEYYANFTRDFSKIVNEGIDLTKFKPDVDVQKALQVIWWVLEGYAMAKQRETDPGIIHDVTRMDALVSEVRSYLTMLKKLMYREEALD